MFLTICSHFTLEYINTQYFRLSFPKVLFSSIVSIAPAIDKKTHST